MSQIHSAAVLGAGTMGAQIAAHLANAGVPVLLLDLDRKTAREGLGRAQQLKPAPFFTSDTANLISVGGFDDEWSKLSGCDWIIEAVVERLDVKQSLIEKLEAVRMAVSISARGTGLVAAIVNLYVLCRTSAPAPQHHCQFAPMNESSGYLLTWNYHGSSPFDSAFSQGA